MIDNTTNTMYRIRDYWTPTKDHIAARTMTKQEIEYFERIINKRQQKTKKTEFLINR